MSESVDCSPLAWNVSLLNRTVAQLHRFQRKNASLNDLSYIQSSTAENFKIESRGRNKNMVVTTITNGMHRLFDAKLCNILFLYCKAKN